MKKVLILLILFVSITLYNVVLAADWQPVSLLTSVDESSIKRKNNYSYVWLKDINQGQFSPYGKQKVSYRLEYIQFDCSNRTYRILSLYDYDSNGINFWSHDYEYPQKILRIVPDTIIDGAYSYACNVPLN